VGGRWRLRLCWTCSGWRSLAAVRAILPHQNLKRRSGRILVSPRRIATAHSPTRLQTDYLASITMPVPRSSGISGGLPALAGPGFSLHACRPHLTGAIRRPQTSATSRAMPKETIAQSCTISTLWPQIFPARLSNDASTPDSVPAECVKHWSPLISALADTTRLSGTRR